MDREMNPSPLSRKKESNNERCGVKTCIIIPAYNVEDTLTQVIKDARKYVKEIIVVDDGSEDSTLLKAKKTGVKVLEHKKNKGKGKALRTGIEYVLKEGFGQIIFIDADGQHDANEIPKFLEAAQDSQVDIIVGSRMSDVKNMPGERLTANRLGSFLTSLLARQEVDDSQSGYRLVKSPVLRAITLTSARYDIESEMLIKAGRRGFKIKSIPIKTIYSTEISHFHKFWDTLRFIKMIFKGIWW
jgi:glycosyltransferase involved in cell wall biosynthesis